MSSSFPMDGMRVRFAGETDTGKTRSYNEDALYLPDNERMVIVADGMGGHASGDVASRMAVDTLVGYFRSTTEEKSTTWPFVVDAENRRDENRLISGIKFANVEIFDAALQDSRCKGMGTTIVVGLFCDDLVFLAHVGDSRIYRIRNSKIEQLSEDHSLLNDYIKMKRIEKGEEHNFPHKNVIVRALGMKETVAVDILKEKPRLGDIYCFCSDGLTDMIDDKTLLKIVQDENDVDRCCERLVAAANAAGGQDNITVAVARLEPL